MQGGLVVRTMNEHGDPVGPSDDPSLTFQPALRIGPWSTLARILLNKTYISFISESFVNLLNNFEMIMLSVCEDAAVV